MDTQVNKWTVYDNWYLNCEFNRRRSAGSGKVSMTRRIPHIKNWKNNLNWDLLPWWNAISIWFYWQSIRIQHIRRWPLLEVLGKINIIFICQAPASQKHLILIKS
jgi:hypothetical protein